MIIHTDQLDICLSFSNEICCGSQFEQNPSHPQWDVIMFPKTTNIVVWLLSKLSSFDETKIFVLCSCSVDLENLIYVCLCLWLTFEVFPLVENVLVLEPLVDPGLSHCDLEAVLLQRHLKMHSGGKLSKGSKHLSCNSHIKSWYLVCAHHFHVINFWEASNKNVHPHSCWIIWKLSF